MKEKNKIFDLRGHDTTIRKELIAGLTSFVAVVYIVAVNSAILADTGIPQEAGIIATVLASFVGCLIMAFWSNAPIILVPGMGVNALFSYTVVKSMGLTWQQALAAVFVAGIIFAIIAFTKLSGIIMKSIPNSLKEAITVGIGLLLTFIGLQKCGIIVPSESTLVALGNFSNPEIYVTIINLIIALILFTKNVPANFLISMVIGTIVSILFGVVDLSQLGSMSFAGGDYGHVFASMDFSFMATSTFWMAAFSIALVLVFENLGLLHGQVEGMLKRPDKFKKSFQACSMSAIACGIFGTSPTVATIETAAGIAAGGKTGLTSIFTGSFFLISLLFIPLIKIIPNSAVSPVLIIIGGLMLENVMKINFKDVAEGFASFLIISMIPLSFSIVDGMAFGFIAYPIIKIAKGEGKKVSAPMYIISLLFLVNFILPAIS